MRFAAKHAPHVSTLFVYSDQSHRSLRECHLLKYCLGYGHVCNKGVRGHGHGPGHGHFPKRKVPAALALFAYFPWFAQMLCYHHKYCETKCLPREKTELRNLSMAHGSCIVPTEEMFDNVFAKNAFGNSQGEDKHCEVDLKGTC